MVGKKLKSVYLIDDDSINNFINARLIRRLGVSDDVLVSLNGKEAIENLHKIEEAHTDCPTLIFLDINMPVMDGFEFVENYRKMNFVNKAEVVIYLITTSENVKDLDKAKDYPEIAGYINKPLTEEKIERIFNKHFH
jgi:CheY-like chemotaxis protein